MTNHKKKEIKKIFAIAVRPSVIEEFDFYAGRFKRSSFIERSLINFVKKRRSGFSQSPDLHQTAKKGVCL